MTLAEQELLESPRLSEHHTIVLVDDDPEVLAALQRALRGEPYAVLATTRADLALEWIGRGGVSLVVVDQRMAGIGGTGLAERVRRISPGTLRVLLTAYPGTSLVLHGLADDVDWLLSKPWDDDALRRTIRRLLHDLEPHGIPPLRSAGFDWSRVEWAIRRTAWAFVQGTRWIVGFLWMADAGGRWVP
jgi:response regulator RpfG family c-di-GMP phosphodiesterase